MIKKERLEELIEKGAIIYYPISMGANTLQLTRLWRVVDTENGLYLWCADKPIYPLEILFENEQDCEEYVEFGNITRTDTIKFPIWEDVKDTGYDEIFFVKDNRFDSGIVQYYFLVAEQTNQIQIMFREIEHIMTIDAYDVVFQKPLTQENYNEARRLCIKLFKGEEI